MKKCSGFIDSIETMGLVDGPGIRTVIFLSGCKLRCLYCHNPEMWKMNGKEYLPEDILKKVLRSKPYFGNNGGVTFSGGEPLLQSEFLKETFKLLKKENIHIALDTAGVGNGDYEDILSLTDLIIFDVKYADKLGYKKITGHDIEESEKFIEAMNKSGKDVWIRQVIVPSYMDSDEYIDSLAHYILKIKNIKKIEFLPFHHLGFSKYEELDYLNPLENIPEMNKYKCDLLYNKFLEKYNKLKKFSFNKNANH